MGVNRTRFATVCGIIRRVKISRIYVNEPRERGGSEPVPTKPLPLAQHKKRCSISVNGRTETMNPIKSAFDFSRATRHRFCFDSRQLQSTKRSCDDLATEVVASHYTLQAC